MNYEQIQREENTRLAYFQQLYQQAEKDKLLLQTRHDSRQTFTPSRLRGMNKRQFKVWAQWGWMLITPQEYLDSLYKERNKILKHIDKWETRIRDEFSGVIVGKTR